METSGFEVVTCRLEPCVELAVLREVLVKRGQVMGLGKRGLRVTPGEDRYPPCYFAPDGTVEIALSGFYLADAMDFVEAIAQEVGARAAWNWRRGVA